MRCKMDVDDPQANLIRKMACVHNAEPQTPTEGSGCSCSTCGVTCRECIGFGFVSIAPRRCQEILTAIRSQILRAMKVKGRPPGFVRLRDPEIEVVRRKFRSEDDSHWVKWLVRDGPPLRIYDVMVVSDIRKALTI